MNSIWLVIGSLAAFILAYKFYGGFIAKKIFRADTTNPVPSEELRDDVDYMPTNKEVLFGHHFASIAGTGPIVGPAIAIIWGWLPAVVWIIVGSIFAGAVHDYAALIISTRKKGVSIGELSREVISPRVRTLFLLALLYNRLSFFILALSCIGIGKNINEIHSRFIKFLSVLYLIFNQRPSNNFYKIRLPRLSYLTIKLNLICLNG